MGVTHSNPAGTPKPRRQQRVFLMVGTRKGAFVFESNPSRLRWNLLGPHHKGIEVNHVIMDARNGRSIFAAVTSPWFGTRIYRTENLGATWKESSAGLRFSPDSGMTVARIWHVQPGHPSEPRVLYAGVDPGALFKSEDGGRAWAATDSLNNHPTRARWTPGAGGMMVHSIQIDPEQPQRIYVGISAAGVFRTDDGGATWTPANKGVRADFLPIKNPEVGQCVHKLLSAPTGKGVLFQQNRRGVYRTRSGGGSWTDIGGGLPSRFGFPLAVNPHEPETIYVVPEVADRARLTPEGRFTIYRSRNGGKEWQPLTRGLPQKHAFFHVFREAMTAGRCDPAGVYVGTATGQIFYSRDGGDHWEPLADGLPPIYSLEAATPTTD